jgi:hypothetical protein
MINDGGYMMRDESSTINKLEIRRADILVCHGMTGGKACLTFHLIFSVPCAFWSFV